MVAGAVAAVWLSTAATVLVLWRGLDKESEFLAAKSQGLDVRTSVGSAYAEGIYRDAHSTLGPYFRSLYHVFKFIAEQPEETLSRQQRRAYANIARAHLRADDLVLLAVNGCSPAGEGFRQYIEEFGLLKHYADPRSDAAARKCYRPRAFKGAEESYPRR